MKGPWNMEEPPSYYQQCEPFDNPNHYREWARDSLLDPVARLGNTVIQARVGWTGAVAALYLPYALTVFAVASAMDAIRNRVRR